MARFPSIDTTGQFEAPEVRDRVRDLTQPLVTDAVYQINSRYGSLPAQITVLQDTMLPRDQAEQYGIEGPQGPAPILETGTTEQLPAGEHAQVTVTKISDTNYRVDARIPRGLDGDPTAVADFAQALAAEVNTHGSPGHLAVNNAVSGLVEDPSSAVGGSLRGLFPTHSDIANLDTSRNYVRHRDYGVVDRDTLQAALDVIPSDSVLTLPHDMEIEVGNGTPILMTRDNIGLKGGRFVGSMDMLEITGDNCLLEDTVFVDTHEVVPEPVDIQRHFTVRVAGGDRHLPLDQYIKTTIRGVEVYNPSGTAIQGSRIDGFVIERCKVHNLGYAGIALYQAHNGRIIFNEIMHGRSNEHVNWNCYGISTSNHRDDPFEKRCHNIQVMFNRVHGIVDWEGIETHNGQNHDFSHNTITACRRSIALVSNMPAKDSGASRNRVIGNFIDNAGHSRDHFNDDIGIRFGGDPHMRGDAIITGNTIRNSEYPIRFFQGNPENYFYEYCKVYGNSIDNHQRLAQGTEYDTGWLIPTQLLYAEPGVGFGNTDPLRVRVVGDNHGRTMYLRGAISRQNESGNLYRLGDGAINYMIPDVNFGTRDRVLVGLAYRLSDQSDTKGMFLSSDGLISIDDESRSSFMIDVKIRA